MLPSISLMATSQGSKGQLQAEDEKSSPIWGEQDGDEPASLLGFPMRIPTWEVQATPTFLPVFSCGAGVGLHYSSQHSDAMHDIAPCWGIALDLQVQWERESEEDTKCPTTVWAGHWMGGEQRAWKRMSALLVSKGMGTALSLPGGCQDEPKHPQLLLPLCWEESSSGEPGTQLPALWEQPALLQRC